MATPKPLQVLLGGVRLVDESGQPLSDSNGITVSPVAINASSQGVDAFSRLRVSNPTTIFEGLFRYGREPLVATKAAGFLSWVERR